MKKYNLSEMKRGWFIGNFAPAALNTSTCEVAIKKYTSGEFEEAHYHAIATEVTAIISGTVQMGGQVYSTGDIIVLSPGDTTEFKAITDTITVVIKAPSVPNDKYILTDVQNIPHD